MTQVVAFSSSRAVGSWLQAEKSPAACCRLCSDHWASLCQAQGILEPGCAHANSSSNGR